MLKEIHLHENSIFESALIDWRLKLAKADDIDDISEVFRILFKNDIPSSESPYFKDTFSSQAMSIDKLIAREPVDPDRLKRAHAYMQAAKSGEGEKRKPIYVLDMGNGQYKVLDGNTTLHALKELGETQVVVEIKKSLKQQVPDQNSMDAVYDQAAKALPVFEEWVKEYAKKTGASRVMLRPGLKGRERAGQKVANDYAGCAARLTDIVGGTLLYDKVEDVVTAFGLIGKDPAVFKAKNRFENPTSDGYRDIMMVVNVGGHLCELQLNTHAILEAKEKGLGHKLYEITRNLEPIAKQESADGDFDFVAQGYIDALRKVSVKVYRNAAMSSANSSASSMASDSEIGDEFNRILQRLSGSSISTHFAGLRESIRKMLPVNFSIAKATSSFSTKSNMSDFMAGIAPFSQNIIRNGKKVNAKVITGRYTRAYLNDGSMLKLQYAVVESADLVTSHNTDFSLNPEFPQELQPRDRTRDAMKQQISSISGKLNPDLLGGSLYASVGSPIVGRDLLVESGNGRTMAIKARIMRDGAEQYRMWIINEAAPKVGIDPEQVKAMTNPILVRIRLSDQNRKTVTERSNEGDIAAMSPSEAAQVDSSRVTPDDMDLFRAGDDGEIGTLANNAFITRFLAILGPAESAGMLTADGKPTRQLLDRIQAAVFDKAFDDERLLALMAEEANPDIRNILRALTITAPSFAKVKAMIGNEQIDAINHIIGAVDLIRRAKRENESVENILNQLGLFGEEIPEETAMVARFLVKNARSAKRIADVLQAVAAKYRYWAENQNQPDLFGNLPEKPNADDVLRSAIIEAEGNKQMGLFESAQDDVSEMRVAVSIDKNQVPVDVPPNWIVFNASRPLYGDREWQGDFIHGRFYVAVDPGGERAQWYIQQNQSQDAWVYQNVDSATMRAMVRQNYIDGYFKGDSAKTDEAMKGFDDEQIKEAFVNFLDKMTYRKFMDLENRLSMPQNIKGENSKNDDLAVYTQRIRNAKSFDDIASVFKDLFDVTPDSLTATTYKNPTSEYGVRVRGIKSREKINAQCREILDRVHSPNDLTLEEKDLLKQYSGKGGLTENSQYEYYTPDFVATGIWDALIENGFQNGHVCDPCTGAGVFSGTKPQGQGIAITGCDIDPVGSKIASLLNPSDTIENKPFEAVVMETPDNSFDAFVGNVPFGDARGKSTHLDPEYKGEKRIERYFILRALDKVKPGGLCAFVVPTNIVGARSSNWEQFRITCSKKAEFLGAHKLPSKTFAAQGTDTVVDVVVFKKHGQDLLDRIPDLPFDTLKQANVVWDEFVQGQYWMGEGKPFIMGKYVPKIEGDRWSREVVDGDIDSQAIRQKLAVKFHTRIDWEMLNAAPPITRNYIDGDRRIMNGQEFELVHGQWVHVVQTMTTNKLDAATYGAESVEELESILSNDKTAMNLTADQMWAAYKMIAEKCTEVQKQAIEFAMSQSDTSLTNQLFRGSMIGAMISRYYQSTIDGQADDTERLMLQDLVSAEIQTYGHPRNNAKLKLTGESSRMFGMFLTAVDENGNFSDLLSGTLQAKAETRFDSTNIQSIVEHLFNREGIFNIELEDIRRLYTGKDELTIEAIAEHPQLAITPEMMVIPLGRYCSGDIYPKIQAMIDAMAADNIDDRIKSKWRQQIDEINRKRIKTDPENITFGLRQKWFPVKYVVDFLRSNGYPKVNYGRFVDIEKEDVVTGKKYTTQQFQEDMDTPFGEFIGIDGQGFPKQFLKYLNGGNVTSSDQDRIVEYKNQARVIEENFDVWMKQHLDIADIGELYNRKFNGYLRYDNDGSDLGLKNVSPQVKLHDFQNAGIRRLSEDGRGILGYDVGLGKTFTALGLIAYNNQMGRSTKTCIVVPDSVLENWYHSAKSFYGDMKDVLVVGYEPMLNKDGSIQQEVVLDEKGNPKRNHHTGEIEYQDKLIKRNSKQDVWEKMWEIPQTNKKVVIMSKEKFAMIPMMPQTKEAYTSKMLEKALISDKNAKAITAENKSSDKVITYQDAKDRDRWAGKYSDEGTKKAGELPYMEMMGFSDVVVDEGHYFKNSYQGGEKTSDIAYLPNAPSAKRSLDMNMKLNFIRDANSGRGAYILTATPVTNSPTEIFNMLSLVCDVTEFERFGIYTVDDFIRVFGNVQPVDKVRVDGSITTKDGLVGFQNLGGLRSIFHKYVLLKNAADVNLPLPPHEDIHEAVELTQEQMSVYETLREMAKEAATPGNKKRGEESMFGIIRNMDRVTTDMDLYRKTMTFVFRLEDRAQVDALIQGLPKSVAVDDIDEDTHEKIKYQKPITTDTRIEGKNYILVVPEEFENHVVSRLQQFGIKESDVTHPLMPKYGKLVENMKKELETQGKQLIFTEEKTQHEKIMRILVHNIPMISDQIGIINAETASGGAMQGISDSYNSGKLSVVIANKKAEVGVNLQKGTTAIHHLTLPWTPASIQQRNGRGVRQGNTAENIHIYYYLGRGSFDEYRLDLLRRKSNWIRDLFTGNEETAENANAFNGDDYMDMLEADPEVAKQRRLERLQRKKQDDAEKERKRIVNQLQVLISVSKTLKTLDADKEIARQKLIDRQDETNAKIKRIQTSLTEVDPKDEKHGKLVENLVQTQTDLKRITDRLTTLDTDFAKKQTDLESRQKQISGYMKGMEKKGQLPFSVELVDHPENALVSLSGNVISVGDVFEDSEGKLTRIVDVNHYKKTFQINDVLSPSSYQPWNGNPDKFLAENKRVSYSQAEIDERKILTSVYTYESLIKIDKAIYLKYKGQIQIANRSDYVFARKEGKPEIISRIQWFGNDAAELIYPEPCDEDFVKSFAVAALARIKIEKHISMDMLRFLNSILGDQYHDILTKYSKNATKTEILSAAAKVYQDRYNELLSQGVTDVEDLYGRLGPSMGNAIEKVLGILSEYDNIEEIEIEARNYLSEKVLDLGKQADEQRRQKALEAKKAEEERLKTIPGYKEIPQDVRDAFKKIGIRVEVNTGDLTYSVGKYKSERAKPFSRWLFQDSSGFGGRLYQTKEVLKSRYGAKFFKDEGRYTGAWWHLPSSYSLDDIYKLLA